MKLVLTLIAAPNSNALTKNVIDQAAIALTGAGQIPALLISRSLISNSFRLLSESARLIIYPPLRALEFFAAQRG